MIKKTAGMTRDSMEQDHQDPLWSDTMIKQLFGMEHARTTKNNLLWYSRTAIAEVIRCVLIFLMVKKPTWT
jgi:hypothetical protein